MRDRDQVVAEAVAGGRVNASGWVRVDCPGFCEERGKSVDRGAAFAYNPATGGYVCNRCGAKGRLGGPHRPAEFKRAPRTSVGPTKPREAVPLCGAASRTSASLGPAYACLRRRGFTDADVRRANMHACASGVYAGRIVLPHMDPDGTWWGFTARLWTDPVPSGVMKSLYPPGMPRRLYNEAALQVETDEPCLVVEGVLDAVRYLPDVVACLGKPTTEHWETIVTARRPVVFALDGDAVDTSKAWAVKCTFAGLRAGFVKLPPGEDPDTVDPAWLWEHAKRAVNFFR